MSEAIAVRFPTGVVDVGWGATVQEAGSYAFRARVQPWCVQPERWEVARLRMRLWERCGHRHERLVDVFEGAGYHWCPDCRANGFSHWFDTDGAVEWYPPAPLIALSDTV